MHLINKPDTEYTGQVRCKVQQTEICRRRIDKIGDLNIILDCCLVFKLSTKHNFEEKIADITEMRNIV